MNAEMLRFLIYSTLCWAVFLTVYRVMIVQSGSPKQQRFYILGALISGAVIPLLFWPQPHMNTLVVTLPEVWIGQELHPQDSFSSPLGWNFIVPVLYVSGLIVMLVRFVLGIRHLIQIRKMSTREILEDYTIYRMPAPGVPFQFLNTLYIPVQLKTHSDEFQMAFQHERAHGRLFHSIDLLLGHLFQVIFWFHPVVHRLIRDLRMVHELQADQYVIHGQDRDQYARFIGTFQPASVPKLPLHTIIQGPLKTRIMHMYQPAKSWKLHQVCIIALTVLTLVGFTSFSNVALETMDIQGPRTMASIDSAGPDHQTRVLPDEELFVVAESMPRFPGCEDQGLTKAELEACAQNKLLMFIYSNLTYPKEAVEKGIEGTTITSFIVEKDGSLSQVEVLRDIGGGTREAVLQVFEKMQAEGIRWIPGVQEGTTVRVAFKLPIKFKLSSDTDKPGKRKKK